MVGRQAGFAFKGGFQQRVDGALERIEGLIRAGGRLQASLAVNQKHCRIARDVAAEAGDLAADGEERVGHGDLFLRFNREKAVRFDQNCGTTDEDFRRAKIVKAHIGKGEGDGHVWID